MSFLKVQSKKVPFTLPALLFFFTITAHAHVDCTVLQSSPVFQTINPMSNTNLLTVSKKEITNAVQYGFTANQGIAFYASKVPTEGLVAVHRLYSAKTGDFRWAIDQNEIASAIKKNGYADHGVNFFASNTPSACTQPVYRYALGNIHRYVTSQKDMDTLEAAGWTYEAIEFYAGASLPAFGINIGAPKDWSSEWFFTDVMKAARPFADHSANPWAGLEFPAAVDAQGWPLGDAGVLVMAINSQRPKVKPHISGTYQLSFQGTATKNMQVKANGKPLTIRYDAATQRYIADVYYDNKNNLFFTFEGIHRGAKDIRLIRPGDKLADTFNALFLQSLKAGNDMFGIIRFMETTATNGHPIDRWADRTHKTYATQQRQFKQRDAGMAWEYVIELSNQTGKDPWINIPHQASDEYVRELALLLRNTLDSHRKIYLEYSNEIWNEMNSPHFVQRWEVSKVACNKVLNGDPDHYYLGLTGDRLTCKQPQVGNEGLEYAFLGRHTAWRLKQISDIFREVFGDEAVPSRVRPILAWDIWTVARTKPGSLVDQLAYLNQHYGPPSQYIYGVAVGAYISMLNKEGETEHPYNLPLSVDEMFARMTTYNETVLPHRFNALRNLADQYDLKMFAYEGGTGIYSSKNFDNMLAAQTDPRMKRLIKALLQHWKNAGGDTFLYYNLTGSYHSHNLFSLSEQLDDENTLKWQAVKEIAAEWQ